MDEVLPWFREIPARPARLGSRSVAQAGVRVAGGVVCAAGIPMPMVRRRVPSDEVFRRPRRERWARSINLEHTVPS